MNHYAVREGKGSTTTTFRSREAAMKYAAVVNGKVYLRGGQIWPPKGHFAESLGIALHQGKA